MSGLLDNWCKNNHSFFGHGVANQCAILPIGVCEAEDKFGAVDGAYNRGLQPQIIFVPLCRSGHSEIYLDPDPDDRIFPTAIDAIARL